MSTLPYDASREALFLPERGPSMFGRSQPPDELALAGEAARLAYIRAEESDDEAARLADSLALAGFAAPTLFDDESTDAQGYAAQRSDGLALVAFRGTQPDRIGDLCGDLGFVPAPALAGFGLVHGGFRDSAQALLPQVTEWLQGPGRARRRLLVCGHSLGAAIATLLAASMQADHLVTIGSPRVGDRRFAAGISALAGLTITRVVNCCDVVTELPPELPLFTHVGQLVYIDREGRMRLEPPPAFVEADRAQARAEYLHAYAFRNGTVLLRDIADHAPINYVRGMWP